MVSHYKRFERLQQTYSGRLATQQLERIAAGIRTPGRDAGV